MRRNDPKTGISLALMCLMILGVMPIVSNSRPAEIDALSFAFLLSAWQFVFALPLFLRELTSADPGIFAASVPRRIKRRTLTVVLATGAIFGLSTYAYVLAVEKAGAVGAAIAIQSYPLFAILWETLFLKRRKTALELVFTFALLAAIAYLATGGTWRIEGLSIWILFALTVPFLWSVAHVILREVLGSSPITPAQITFFRVAVSCVFLGALLLVRPDGSLPLSDLFNPDFQLFAIAMGAIYYLELIVWFYAMRHIDVSLASSITAPWPAVTMVLAVVFMNETVATYQIVAFIVVATSLYGLIYAGARKQAALETAPEASATET